ncbi:MAG: aldehyde dehydrogenase family protein [Ignavibacteriae bacterium]|nr:aldehyde dehydrogenase family protein [Ignavibacteria bacterium]MBI3363388.1 aldehyde dehydrogenase family protein [Ignavibacteriota bacterium]
MREYRLYIDGQFVESASKKTFDSINPFNQEIVARVSLAGIDDAQHAIAAARKAFDNGPWQRMSKEERSALIKAVSDKINERKSGFEQLEVDDSGGTIRKVKEDVYLSARAMNYFSKLAAMDPFEPVDGLSKPGFSQNLVVREPIGVVAAIIPWNFPLKMAVWKLGPALAAGNTVVLKPSELTPVTAMELANIFHEVGFPPGVVNIVPGYGSDVGEELAGNPMVDKVSFTGSTTIGKRVMSLASESLKKCTLECGGKSANIILDDADLSIAVDGALYAIFYHQGQCCEAGTRLFLPEKLHDEFVARMIETTKKMKLGDPKDPSTDNGPVISAKQRDRILGYIAGGVKQGAKVALGGSTPKDPALRNGFFVEPTILTGVDNTMTIAQEEIFGPVLSVITYKSVEDAVAKANDTVYGLGGGVWSRDREKAMTVARQLRAGTVWINEWHLISEKAPFGGYKQSGIGREFGVEGLREYMETKHLHIDELGSREKKFWYDTVVPKS